MTVGIEARREYERWPKRKEKEVKIVNWRYGYAVSGVVVHPSRIELEMDASKNRMSRVDRSKDSRNG